MKISPVQLRRLIIQETRRVLRENEDNPPVTKRSPGEAMIASVAGVIDDKEITELLNKDIEDSEREILQLMLQLKTKSKELSKSGPETKRGVAPPHHGGPRAEEYWDEPPLTQRAGAHGFGPVKHNPANESYRRRYARNRTWFGR